MNPSFKRRLVLIFGIVIGILLSLSAVNAASAEDFPSAQPGYWAVPVDVETFSRYSIDQPGVTYDNMGEEQRAFAALSSEVVATVEYCQKAAQLSVYDPNGNGIYDDGDYAPGTNVSLCNGLPTSGVIADCHDGYCEAPLIGLTGNVEFGLYTASNVAAVQRSKACQNSSQFKSIEDLMACFQNAGCPAQAQESGGVSSTSQSCEFVNTKIGSITVDMDKWYEYWGLTPSEVAAPAEFQQFVLSPLGVSGGGTELSSPSVLSTLPTWGDPGQIAVKASVAAVATSVLAILVMLPTHLINSTLDANAALIRRWGARIPWRRKRTYPDSLAGTEEKPADGAINPARARLNSLLKSLPVFAAASIITAFVDPSVGLNWLTVRIVLTALLTFLLLNYTAVVLVWWMFRNAATSIVPTVRVRYAYLGVLLLTVIASRALQLQPVIVFGAVLAIETGRVVADVSKQLTENRMRGRIQLSSIGFAVAVGLVGWTLYNVFVQSTGQVVVSEFFAALTIEALATLPIVLLPARFMPGASLFAWNRWLWGVTYVVGLTLFAVVLVPMPQSWDSVGVTLFSWVTVFIAYCLLAALIWLVFTIASRNSKVPANQELASPQPKGNAMDAQSTEDSVSIGPDDIVDSDTAIEQVTTTSPLLRRTNSLAIVSLVAAVFWFGGIPAIVLGNVALTQIRKYDERGKWMAVTGLVLGYLSLLFWGVIIVLTIRTVNDAVTWINENPSTINALMQSISDFFSSVSGRAPGAGMPTDPTIQVGPDGLNYYVYPDGTWVPAQ